ncbi:myrosinase 1-like [Ostrinia furnacalis]|uniref:myrosinase 1-like n=1 Tax=Ostrinia furnacalis TaxID=93504 RepID=UPI00103D0504|nr:myrosinase 1-like [Ostrinia furnacalis]
MSCKLIFLFLALVYAHSNAVSVRQNVRKFPDGFAFGAATASYQVEGAWNEDGKSENIWDHLTHSQPNPVKDGSSGDVAANSYHLYKRDVEMMRELGLQFYRFSLSWSRLLPTGFPDVINQAGVDYYNNLIDEMLKYNIQPMITLYHWDLPQKLQEMGGWTNSHIVDWFGDYAQVAFKLFGDRVKSWITINEPHSICYYGYSIGHFAPRIDSSGVSEYMCTKYLLLAHARAYHIYDQEFRPSQNGNIFIALSGQWYQSETDEYHDAAEDYIQFTVGQYAHPIFSTTGDWPPVMKERIAAKSAEQGFFRSRLPAFSPEEVEYIRGSSDFFGLNHYTTYYVYRNESSTNFAVPSFEDDIGADRYQLQEWHTQKDVKYIGHVPWGFTKLLVKIKEDYNDVPIQITENGFSTLPGLEDDTRVAYYFDYLNALLDAVESGVDVRSYAAWSLLDNFEWIEGYGIRFGLYEVDFEDEARPRTPRKSAFLYKEIVRTRALDPSFEPDASATMTIDQGH